MVLLTICYVCCVYFYQPEPRSKQGAHPSSINLIPTSSTMISTKTTCRTPEGFTGAPAQPSKPITIVTSALIQHLESLSPHHQRRISAWNQIWLMLRSLKPSHHLKSPLLYHQSRILVLIKDRLRLPTLWRNDIIHDWAWYYIYYGV